MKSYSYFPGCSSAEGTSVAYGLSARAVAGPLDLELKEIRDWNCCGSMPYWTLDALGSACVSARNLALAEQAGLDLVTPCSSCYFMLRRANAFFAPGARPPLDLKRILKEAGLEYHGTVRVRHLAEVFLEDIGPAGIAARVRKKLTGMRVACYYGCQIVRPDGIDHPEFPSSLERVVGSLGAVPVDFPLKTRCCGGSLIISEEELALGLVRKLLDSAAANGAECLVTVCPLCQTNLDAYQARVNARFGTSYSLPVLYLTQLVGYAVGVEPRPLGLDKNVVSPLPLLARYVA